MVKWDPMTRRHFLIGAGGYALALPILPSLIPRLAAAAAAGSPAKRFICLWNDHGIIRENYWPQPSGGVSLPDGATEYDLANVSGDLSRDFGPRFDPFRSQLLFLKNLDHYGGGTESHRPSVALGGNAYSGDMDYIGDPSQLYPTLDQILAASSKIYPTEPRTRLLYQKAIFTDSADSGQSISFKAVGPRMNRDYAITSPKAAFDRLFDPGSGGGGGGGGGGGSNGAATAKARKLKVVDKLLGAHQALKANRRISSADLQSVDEVLTGLSELQSRVNQINTGGGNPAPPSCPSLSAPLAGYNETANHSNFEALMQAHIDVMVAAIKCGHTKIAALMLGDHNDGFSYRFLIANPSDSFHNNAHNNEGPWKPNYDNAVREFAIVYRWLADRVAYVLEQLNSVEDPVSGRTFLDNTVVFWANNHGLGTHANGQMPVMLAGGRGVLRRGKLIDYGTRAKRIPYQQVLVTIAEAMGLSRADYELYGRKGFGDYNYDSSRYDLSDAIVRSSLPGARV